MRTLNSSEQTYSPPKSHSGHILAVCSLNKGNSHIYFTFPQTYFLGNTTSLKTHPKCPTPSPTSVQTFQKRSGDETTQNVFSIYSATILEGVWVHVSWVYSRPPLFHTVPPPPLPPSFPPSFQTVDPHYSIHTVLSLPPPPSILNLFQTPEMGNLVLPWIPSLPGMHPQIFVELGIWYLVGIAWGFHQSTAPLLKMPPEELHDNISLDGHLVLDS